MQSLTLEILYKVREKLAKHWTKGAYARANDGVTVPSTSTAACSWCMVGAIQSVCYGQDEPTTAEGIIRLIADKKDYYASKSKITSYNDRLATTNQDVLAWIDRTIQKVKETENAIPNS